MPTINADKEVVQSRLDKYFDSFREEEINGTSFEMMPLKDEVPLVKQVSYSPGKDVFEIVFEYQESVISKKTGNVIFIEDKQGRLVGIQVVQLKSNNVKEIMLEVITNLDRVIQAASIKQTISIQDAASLDIEKRKMDFFKEVVQEDLPVLVR